MCPRVIPPGNFTKHGSATWKNVSGPPCAAPCWKIPDCLLDGTPNDPELKNPDVKSAMAGAERRVANLRQMLTALEQAGHGFNLDLLGLLDWLREERRTAARRRGEPAWCLAEMSRPKVKIMTIHASKGLEFPIVFLAGGYTQGRVGDALSPYRDDEGRLVFDWSPDSQANERVAAEQLSEQRRLLYVALTRPIFKLYIPKVKVGARARAYAGPVGTILLPALDQACPDKLGPLIAEVIVPPLRPSTRRKRSPRRTRPLPPGKNCPSPSPAHCFRRIPTRRSVQAPPIVTRSFSSMTRQHLSLVGEGSSFGDPRRFAEDEAAPAADRQDPLRGPVFGDMVHNVLETIDFAEVARAAKPDALFQPGTPARQQIDEQIKVHGPKLRTRIPPINQLEQVCRQQIAELGLACPPTRPLSEIGGPLCDIPSADRLAEVEFLLPERPGAILPADVRWEEGFITGYMDLLFRKHDKYYLVDWKTNLLPAYDQEHIKRSMDESDYHRQYRLYLHGAVRAWLRARCIGHAAVPVS